ncbi:hypothetical protein JTB14_034142 [Gonioctena quinquepunctata]|nr:hypothetical protein JTB14_034142 [Gonioctena quinquepunctata]
MEILLVLLVVCGVSSVPLTTSEPEELGCVKCHPTDDTKINVHLIPHSHDDVGWLKTVDEYYYGLDSSTQKASVKNILDSVVASLIKNSERRYIQVETAYFWKWWQDQDDKQRWQFRSLVDNGQIEMVNGAWSMNDEACTNYQSTIDQFTWGLRTIKETLGKCGTPRIGWQIDPFGHSREQASLLSEMGYDGVFFSRLDHDDEKQRKKERTLDFAWQGSTSLEESIIFGSIFGYLYNPPKGYCWDIECGDQQIVDNPKSPNYNIQRKVDGFMEIIKSEAAHYPTNNIMIPMGGDFHYQVAEKNYDNIDKFLRGFKNRTEVNVIYSTPSCYLRAVNEAKPNLTLKTDDFFPYSVNSHSFWTGYFTSRPNSKRFERVGHNILQVSKQLYAQGSIQSNDKYDEDDLTDLREVMGVMQHHDDITGTEKQHVANDYVRMLTEAIETAEKPIGNIVSELLDLDPTLNLSFSSCLLSNISICHVSQNSDQFVVVLYNPLAWNVTHYVRLPVEGKNFEIRGPDGAEVFDLVPFYGNFPYVNITGSKQATHDLVFAARNIPPLGLKLYYVSRKDSEKSSGTAKQFVNKTSAFSVSSATNLLESITLNGRTLGITQNFHYYFSYEGLKDSGYVSSGAYLFLPNDTIPAALRDITVLRTFSGNLVEEVHQKWNDSAVEIYQSIRWYKDEDYVELDWIVGNIIVHSDITGIEVVSKFTVTDDFDNKNTFYTDSNGREMMKRIKNHRPDYAYDPVKEPVASNYYPVTSRITIKDEDRNIEVAVLTDRSQGGSSLNINELELMVHRRIHSDDYKGVGEDLDEKEFGDYGVYVRGSHYLVIGKATGSNTNGKSTSAQERILAQKKLLQPWIGLAPISKPFEEIHKTSKLMYSGLVAPFPENINILTLEPWANDTYLLRMEHIMEKGEDSHLSDDVTINHIKDIFKGIEIRGMEGTTLAGNMLLDDFKRMKKYQWHITNSSLDVKIQSEEKTGDYVTLKAMEIKTFIVELGKRTYGGANSGTNLE